MCDVLDRAERAGSSRVYALGAAALCELGPSTDVTGDLDLDVAAIVDKAMAWCTDPAARARCAGEAVLFFSMTGEVGRYRAYFEEAVALARQVGDDEVIMSALGNADLCLTHPADLDRRTDLASEMLVVAERLGADRVMEALHFSFAVQLQRADPMLRTTLARQSSLAATVGSAARRWMATYQQACLRYLEARLDEAEALARRACEIAPVSPMRAHLTSLITIMGIRAAQGRWAEIGDELDRAASVNPGMPAWRAVATWPAAHLGRAERVCADVDALRGGADLPLDMGWSGAVMLMGRAVAHIGDVERSRVAYDLMRPFAGQFTWIGASSTGPFDLALGELALVLGDHRAAARHADATARSIDRIGAVVFRPDLDRLRSAIAGTRD